MSDSSYITFSRKIGYSPTIKDAEKFCFDARLKGASDKTTMSVDNYNDSWSVRIPEADSSLSFAAPQPKSKDRGSNALFITVIIALVLALVGVLIVS